MANITISQEAINALNDLISKDWERVIKDSPIAISLLKEGSQVAGDGSRHTWRNAYHAPKLITQTSFTPTNPAATEGTFVFPSDQARFLRVGDTLTLNNDSVVIKVLGISGPNITAQIMLSNGVTNWNGSLLDPALGFGGTGLPTGSATWVVGPPVVPEINFLPDGRSDFKMDSQDWNGISIIRRQFIVTETMLRTATWDDSSQIPMQLDNMVLSTIDDINRMFITGMERSTSSATADITANSGGIPWLASVDNSLDHTIGCAKLYKTTPSPLEYDDVMDLLEMVIGYSTAQTGNWALLCGTNVQKQISKWLPSYFATIVAGMEDTIFGKFHNRLISRFGTGIIPVIRDGNMPDNQVFLFNTDNVRIVYYEKPSIKHIPGELLNDMDGSAVRIKTKFTFEYPNSFANVGVIYNIS